MAVRIFTTYMHDYIDPSRMPGAVQHQRLAATDHSSRNCSGFSAKLLAQLNARCGATDEGRGHSEWTAIAPVGCLIRTRILPWATGGNEARSDGATSRCHRLRPNRFLIGLATNMPQLYEQLRTQNPAGSKHSARSASTYQMDYGGICEYPMGTYDSRALAAELFPAACPAMRDPCSVEVVFPDRQANELKQIELSRLSPEAKNVRVEHDCVVECPTIRGHWQAEGKGIPLRDANAMNLCRSSVNSCRLRNPDADEAPACAFGCCRAKRCRHGQTYDLFVR